MAQSQTALVQNSFTGGLKTEFTGLNFPENACTQVENCVFTVVGDVLRREGIDYEDNFDTFAGDRTNQALSTYKWTNAGGDGQTQLLAIQIGQNVGFYLTSAATASAPISNHVLNSNVNLSTFVPSGGSFDATKECQYDSGNGYLFIFHPNCDPVYCTYNLATNTVTPNRINVLIRDFAGALDGLDTTTRPSTLSNEHQYNLLNQGWRSSKSAWSSVSSTSNAVVSSGNLTWTIGTGLTITAGDVVAITAKGILTGGNYVNVMSGTVVSYAAGPGTITIHIIYTDLHYLTLTYNDWQFFCSTGSLISTFQTAAGAYPSNADVWWTYKDTNDVFNPSATLGQVTIGGQAPRGSFIMSAFANQRGLISGVPDLIDVVTTVRPLTGCWFQGRVWYAGANSSVQGTSLSRYTNWSENIYFSQIVSTPDDFGKCYQNNDPTSQDTFDLLPTDGGVIVIPGSGSVYKLFPITNGLLVFAANGIWFITGGSQLGFIANDYSVPKISNVQTISGSSFVNMLGFPLFWNEEGIYLVEPNQEKKPYGQGGLTVNNLCIGTIQSFYNAIPKISKQYARGDYDPINFVISWVYRSAAESSVTTRYQFDSVLNINTANRAFYPYLIASSGTSPYVHDVKYIYYPAATTAPDPNFKYWTSKASGGTYLFTMAEERDSSFVDWASSGSPLSFNSFFIAGYALKGQAMFKWQPEYVFMYCRNNPASQYNMQGIFDFASTGSSGKYSAKQLTSNASTPSLTGNYDNFGMIVRRHKIRGRGYAFQIYVSSVAGQPFDIMGWAVPAIVNVGV